MLTVLTANAPRWSYSFQSVFKYRITCAMSTFCSRMNPTTGKLDWVLQDDNYDFHQEVARSAYADMLHDTERNQKYYSALRDAIDLMHSRNKPAHVLDIGTGTGLLSMMAVRGGADSVTACEAFQPMADCATEVMKDNKMADKINLIHKRSTDITVGPDGDMTQRANILVTEVFDTELIGEGAIGTFHHAHRCLLEKDCIVVPSAANMYVQIVQSDVLSRMHRLFPVKVDGGDDISPPSDFVDHAGGAALLDLQLSQVSQQLFDQITEPVKVFRFDYSGKTPIVFNNHSVTKAVASRGGQCDAVLMWWDLEMDTEGKTLLSCAPSWAHPQPQQLQWRDHWMQAIYFPHKPLSVDQEQSFYVHSCHDEYSLWFDVTDMTCRDKPKAPLSTHGAPVYSRNRLGMLNDPHRNASYVRALKQVLTKDSVCLCTSDGSLLPLLAALVAKQVFTLETSYLCKRILGNFILHNGLENKVKVISRQVEDITENDLQGQKATVLLSEPYYFTSLLPWQHIYFWYLHKELDQVLSPDAVLMPAYATLYVIAVDFEDLWKIRAPVHMCEGFDLTAFDKLIEKSSNIADSEVEPQPLWEYPGKALSKPCKLLTLNFTKLVSQMETMCRQLSVPLVSNGQCNGVALWMDFHLTDSVTITTGPTALPKPGEIIQWDRYHKQGVHLFKKATSIQTDDTPHSVNCTVKFEPRTGDFGFEFDINKTS